MKREVEDLFEEEAKGGEILERLKQVFPHLWEPSGEDREIERLNEHIKNALLYLITHLLDGSYTVKEIPPEFLETIQIEIDGKLYEAVIHRTHWWMKRLLSSAAQKEKLFTSSKARYEKTTSSL